MPLAIESDACTMGGLAAQSAFRVRSLDAVLRRAIKRCGALARWWRAGMHRAFGCARLSGIAAHPILRVQLAGAGVGLQFSGWPPPC